MQTETAQTRTRPWWALVVAVAALAGSAWLAVASSSGMPAEDASRSPMLAVAPGGTVALADLPVEHQHIYRSAADDPEAFTELRCYCGCEAFLDHRHLLDCFVRPDGGWERHATGCGVCLTEAEIVIERRSEQVPVPEIGREIDESFGAMTGDVSS